MTISQEERRDGSPTRRSTKRLGSVLDETDTASFAERLLAIWKSEEPTINSFADRLFHGVKESDRDIASRYMDERDERHAKRLDAQRKEMAEEARRRRDAPAAPEVPLAERLMRSVGVEPSKGSFAARLQSRVED